MPQPRRSGQGKRGGASSRSGPAKGAGSPASGGKAAGRAKPGSGKPAGKRTTTRASGAGAKSSARGSAAKPGSTSRARDAKAGSTARVGGKSTARARRGSAARATGGAQAKGRPAPQRSRDVDISAKTVAELRQALSSRMIDPLGLVMLTRERIEEAVEDAVTRGRVTADDAQDLVGGLLERGRKQTNDVLANLEQLLSRGREEIEGRTGSARRRGSAAARVARTRVEEATSRARKEAAKHGDPVMARVDQARRAGGIGPSFPITGYDDLTAAQVQSRLADLSPAELRKVRDYERRHANRKTVLAAIAQKLD